LILYYFKLEYDKKKHFNKGISTRFADDDIFDKGGRYRDQLVCQALFLLPVLFLLIGMSLTWSSNISFTTASTQMRLELSDRLNLLHETGEIIKDIIFLLQDTTYPIPGNMTQIPDLEEAILQATEEITFFVNSIDSLSIGRNGLVIFLSVTPLLFTIFGCVFLKAERLRSLLVIILILDILIVLTVTAVIIHSDINIMSKDVCNEFNYSNSIFTMWDTLMASKGIELIQFTFQGLLAVAESGCQAWTNLCMNNPYQICGNFQCTQDSLPNLINVTQIIDQDGSLHSLQDCIMNCLDDGLRESTEEFANDRERYLEVYDRTLSLSILQSQIYAMDTRFELQIVFCQNYESAIRGLDSGTAILLVGDILAIAFFFRFGW